LDSQSVFIRMGDSPPSLPGGNSRRHQAAQTGIPIPTSETLKLREPQLNSHRTQLPQQLPSRCNAPGSGLTRRRRHCKLQLIGTIPWRRRARTAVRRSAPLCSCQEGVRDTSQIHCSNQNLKTAVRTTPLLGSMIGSCKPESQKGGSNSPSRNP
jgi:hypothetical protein